MTHVRAALVLLATFAAADAHAFGSIYVDHNSGIVGMTLNADTAAKATQHAMEACLRAVGKKTADCVLLKDIDRPGFLAVTVSPEIFGFSIGDNEEKAWDDALAACATGAPRKDCNVVLYGIEWKGNLSNSSAKLEATYRSRELAKGPDREAKVAADIAAKSTAPVRPVASNLELLARSKPDRGLLGCKTSCVNGECVRSFADGSAIAFRAPRAFDPVRNEWGWRTEGCEIPADAVVTAPGGKP